MILKKRMRALSVLLVLLLVSAIVAPAVSAEAINWKFPELEINDSLDPIIILSELSPDESVQNDQIIQMTEATKNPTISKIPYRSIIQHSKNGMTRVFDSTGKQLFVTNDADAEKIATPDGYKSASKIHQVPNGSIIRTNGEITTVYSEGERILTVLNPDNSLVLPGYDGWIESARDLSVSELGQFIAYWTVPSSPPSPQADTIDFLFNGIQPSSSGGIVQPVLEWNQAGSGRWTGRAWYVDQYDVGYPSNPINVNVNLRFRTLV